MSNKTRPGMGFEVNIRGAKQEPSAASTDGDAPFCVAVLGNFGGRSSRAGGERTRLAKRKLVAIDRDNFDEVLARFGIEVEIPSERQSGEPIVIPIAQLDDFHPDSLYENAAIFSRLRDLRRRLNDKTRFEPAAREIMALVREDTQSARHSPAPEVGRAGQIPSGRVLDEVLGTTRQGSAELERIVGSGGIDQLIKEIIAPYIEPATDPRQPEMLKAVDVAAAAQMRRILHDPVFQGLEAAWRSVYFLVSRLEAGQDVKVFLLDVSRPELEEDLGGEVSESALHKLLCEPVAGDVRWSLLVGNYAFGDRVSDVLLLSQLGSIAESAQAPFVAGASERLAGCESFARYPDADNWRYQVKPGVEQAWTMLRRSAVAGCIGLALPRFLLRAPYGRNSSPIDAFGFEEQDGDPETAHEHYLWGNAAFLKAEQLARVFTGKGRDMIPGEASQTDGLPMAYREDDGEKMAMPCAEIYLTEKGGRKLADQGLIALWSVRNADAVRSSDFGSLAEDRKTLQGRWAR